MQARKGFTFFLLMGKLGLHKACGNPQAHPFREPWVQLRVILAFAQIQSCPDKHSCIDPGKSRLSSQKEGCNNNLPSSFRLKSLGKL